MSQSRPPSHTEDSPPTSPLRETVDATPAADDHRPNLDDEVSAARGVGAFASILPSTHPVVVFTPCPA